MRYQFTYPCGGPATNLFHFLKGANYKVVIKKAGPNEEGKFHVHIFTGDSNFGDEEIHEIQKTEEQAGRSVARNGAALLLDMVYENVLDQFSDCDYNLEFLPADNRNDTVIVIVHLLAPSEPENNNHLSLESGAALVEATF